MAHFWQSTQPRPPVTFLSGDWGHLVVHEEVVVCALRLGGLEGHQACRSAQAASCASL